MLPLNGSEGEALWSSESDTVLWRVVCSMDGYEYSEFGARSQAVFGEKMNYIAALYENKVMRTGWRV